MFKKLIERVKSFRLSAKHAADFWLVVIPVRRLIIGVLSDVILWSSVVFLAVFCTAMFAEWLRLPTLLPKQNITVYFNDVSQLAVGSPVRFMGVDAGYVTAVVPEGLRVRVDAQLERLALPIPKGSHFTIEFNALAGAKSLEVLPPNSPVVGTWGEVATVGYRVQQPIRLQDVYNTQLLVSEGIVQSMKNIDAYLAQLEGGLPLQERIAQVNNTLVNYQQKFVDMAGNIHRAKGTVHQGLYGSSKQLDKLHGSMMKELGWTADIWDKWPGRVKEAEETTQEWQAWVSNTSAHKLRAQQIKQFGQDQVEFFDWLNQHLPEDVASPAKTEPDAENVALAESTPVNEGPSFKEIMDWLNTTLPQWTDKIEQKEAEYNQDHHHKK